MEVGKGSKDITEGGRFWSRRAREESTAELPERGAKDGQRPHPGNAPECKFQDHPGLVYPASLGSICCPLVDVLEITHTHFPLCFAFASSLWGLWVHLQLAVIRTLLSWI